MKTSVPLGTRFGRYEVVKHLAHGGMADLSVARARGIEGFERHVVIKHLRAPESEDPAFVDMFLTEARLAGALHHHNIIQVHDIGQEDGRHFFAMEYVHGEDLRRFLRTLKDRNQQTPIEHAVTITMAVASALHHAHEQKGSDRQPLGMVHRDITPGNIIVGYDGNVKVVDFGIAKAALRKSEATTQRGMFKGKVPYMSPEQCTTKVIDRRSDLFSLGIVLYELVTVRRLFKGGNEHATMTAVVSGPILPPSELRPDLPGPLEQIILKALARAPADRYQTADEMRIALDTFAEDAGLRTSTSTLASFMKLMFGERPEPWLADDQRVRPDVDFDSPAPEPAKPPALPLGIPRPPTLNGVSARPTSPLVIEPTGEPVPAVANLPPVFEVTPPPTAAFAHAVGDTTAIVKPLSFEIERAKSQGPEVVSSDDELEELPPRRLDLRLVFGGVAAVAVVIAIVIATTSSKDLAPSRPAIEPTAQVPPPVASAARSDQPAEPPIERPAVAPVAAPPSVVAPPVAAPAVAPPAVAPPVAPPAVAPPAVAPVAGPLDVMPEIQADDPKPPAHKPAPRPPRPARPAPPKPKPAKPTWDPDALFLKKKP